MKTRYNKTNNALSIIAIVLTVTLVVGFAFNTIKLHENDDASRKVTMFDLECGTWIPGPEKTVVAEIRRNCIRVKEFLPFEGLDIKLLDADCSVNIFFLSFDDDEFSTLYVASLDMGEDFSSVVEYWDSLGRFSVEDVDYVAISIAIGFDSEVTMFEIPRYANFVEITYIPEK